MANIFVHDDDYPVLQTMDAIEEKEFKDLLISDILKDNKKLKENMLFHSRQVLNTDDNCINCLIEETRYDISVLINKYSYICDIYNIEFRPLSTLYYNPICSKNQNKKTIKQKKKTKIKKPSFTIYEDEDKKTKIKKPSFTIYED